MRVSTFFAATLPQAMEQVREALGPKAVVLSWRNTRGGVEISASVQAEYVAPPKTQPSAQPRAQLREQPRENALRPSPQSRPLVSRDERNDLLSNHFSPDDFLPSQPVPASPSNTPKPAARGLAALVNRQSLTNQRIETKSQSPATSRMGGFQSENRSPSLRVPASPRRPASKDEKENPSFAEKSPIQVGGRLAGFLCRAGLTKAQAQILATHETPELRRALTDALAHALRFAPIEAIPPKPLILVGPPGAGKSTCAAKLAARTIATGHEVLLISADSERCGGTDQLAALAKGLGARFDVVTTLADLSELVIEARGRGIVTLIDAPSACPAQPADMRATARMISGTRLEAVLCLPADMRPDDMDELAAAYQAIGVARAIATRLDLTTRRASVLYALKQADIALAQVSATPYISGGVAMATASRLAGLLLEPFEDALFEGDLAEDAA